MLTLTKGRVNMFQIPAAPQGIPVAWEGHFYGMDSEYIGPLNLQEIEEIRQQRKREDWSAQICESAAIEDLNLQAINKARTEYKNKNPKLGEECDRWGDSTFFR